MVSEVKKVLAKTEDTWEAIFKQGGGQYRKPALVLYRNVTPTACGSGQAAAGPFYCPGDEKIYLDLSFFDQMARRFRAGGDFARAYVIAHEVGHHVQRLTGITAKTDALRQRLSQGEYNKVSVRIELQADCFAGGLGAAREPRAPVPRPGRRRGGARRGERDRRRCAAAPVARRGGAGFVHARHVGAARALVSAPASKAAACEAATRSTQRRCRRPAPYFLASAGVAAAAAR
jgi:hypothetical protein